MIVNRGWSGFVPVRQESLALALCSKTLRLREDELGVVTIKMVNCGHVR